jgi:hypothetical protein
MLPAQSVVPVSARALIAAAHRLGARVAGWEASVKWTLGSSTASPAESESTAAAADGSRVDDERRVLGFSVDGIEAAVLAEVLAILGAPEAATDELLALLPQANFGYLATERDGAKAYLEFPVRLSETDLSGRVRWSPPGLWALACKWRHGESRHRRTRYELVPGATMSRFLSRLRASDPDHPLVGMAAALAARRPRAAADVDAISLYEIRHDDGSRAWDFNVYGFDLDLDAALASELGWPGPAWPGAAAPLGHIAAGRDARSRPYRSLYWRAGSPAPVL